MIVLEKQLILFLLFLFVFADPPAALKSSPSKKGRVSLTVPKCGGPGAAWSASQLPSERDENIYDLRGARSFPTLEDEGQWTQCRAKPHVCQSSSVSCTLLVCSQEGRPVEWLH